MWNIYCSVPVIGDGGSKNGNLQNVEDTRRKTTGKKGGRTYRCI